LHIASILELLWLEELNSLSAPLLPVSNLPHTKSNHSEIDGDAVDVRGP
jgi:hypothetical protein